MRYPEGLVDGFIEFEFIEFEHRESLVIIQSRELVFPHGVDRDQSGSVVRQILDLEPRVSVERQPPCGQTVDLPTFPEPEEYSAQRNTETRHPREHLARGDVDRTREYCLQGPKIGAFVREQVPKLVR